MERKERLALWATITALLKEALPEVQSLMAAQFAQAGTPEPGSALAQAGLQDGAEIVGEFLSQNELGLALEHLCYMIEEAELPISMQTYTALETAGEKMRLPASTWQHLNPTTR